MSANEMERLANQVIPSEARSYALAHGWKRVDRVNGGLAVYERGDGSLDQLLIPMEPAAPDYQRRILDVARNLSEFERRSLQEIINDLLMPDADIVRFRVSSPSLGNDLSLMKGIELLEGARRAILSSAHSVLLPQRFHPRLSRSEPNQLLEACRLRQTEQGSYILAIGCPLNAVDADGLLDGVDPFARLTTKLLMKSLRHLETAIEQDNVAELYTSTDASGENGVMLSANLCDAMLRMQPLGKRGKLSISTAWSSARPIDEEGLTQSLDFPADYFDCIESVSKHLRPPETPRQSLFVGYVDALNGDMGDQGRVEGEVVLLVLHDEDMVKARLNLNADDYEKANNAHMTGGLVKLKAELNLGRRIHRLTNLSGFELVPSPSD